jgi:L-rhamnose mutarotase
VAGFLECAHRGNGPAATANGFRTGGLVMRLRKAFVMSVFPDRHDEYERRHNPIWPELEATLKAHGVHNYSIFLDEATNRLFAYAEIESEHQWAAIAKTEVCRRWWRHMREVMPSNDDDSPQSKPLREVFHLD